MSIKTLVHTLNEGVPTLVDLDIKNLDLSSSYEVEKIIKTIRQLAERCQEAETKNKNQ